METRRLQLLLELSRRGSMAAVADELGVTTSTVSQQIARLGADLGTPLVEPDGRRVRLTPAGRRLADHAVRILAAVDAARLDLDPEAEPGGTVRVAGFATAIRTSLVPVLHGLSRSHPDVRLQIREHEPREALDLLASDDVDLALTYDYELAPTGFERTLVATRLWSAEWGLGVPAGPASVLPGEGEDAAGVMRRFADQDWIVNSRNSADEDVVRTLTSLAGFEPQVVHRVDSLELVQELVLAGLGVGLLPIDDRTRPGVALLALHDPLVRLRAYAVVRRGRSDWPPIALLLERLRQLAAS